jgi:3-dehydroquinate synthase
MSATFEIEIHSSTKSYPVLIGEDVARERLLAEGGLVLCDEALLHLFPFLTSARPISLAAAENRKTLETVADVIEALRDARATRGSHLRVVGGGIIQDIGTFSASCYMRGIAWSYFPTTLLGMVDSCIGGKSSINVGPYKNIAGNFYPPDSVCIDTTFCASLPRVQLIEGLCEAVKICFASFDDSFERYLALTDPLPSSGDSAALTRIIAVTLAAKKRFIEEDEFDTGIRLLLNFGHTFGHALEGASHYRISHGIAVGLGMLTSAAFSESIGVLPVGQSRTRELLQHTRRLLREVPGLGGACDEIDLDDCLHRFASDKKHSAERFQIIAIDAEGRLVRHGINKNADGESRIRSAFASILGEFREVQ